MIAPLSIKWRRAVAAADAVAHGGISSMSNAKATHAIPALRAGRSSPLRRLHDPEGGHHG